MMLLLQRSIGPLKNATDACFVGWFGPIGIDALYYALFAMQQTDDERIWAAGSLVIASSIFAYGITSTPLTLWYGRHAGKEQEEQTAS